MNGDENEHVEVHEISGLASSNLHTAFQEIDAASMGTQCKKPFFHVQLSPPGKGDLTLEQYEKAIADVEKKLGLVGHPRAIVFHEKEGRRHAHAVWSRLHEKEITRKNREAGEKEQGTKLVARQMRHFKTKLNELSLALFYENGHEPPKGLVDKVHTDPNNYDLKIWQQAKRLKEDPRNLKAVIRTALKHSDSRSVFEAKLKDHGMYLAQGRRQRKGKESEKPTFLIVHHSGEPMSLTRYSGMKENEIAPCIGEAKNLPTLAQVRQQIRGQQSRSVQERLEKLKERQEREVRPLLVEKKAVTQNHREERANIKAFQKERWQGEALKRANRLRKGVMGVWDRVSGRRGRVSRQNVEEITRNRRRDRGERHVVIVRQLAERKELQDRIRKIRVSHATERQKLIKELGHSVQITDKHLTNEFNDLSHRIPPEQQTEHLRDSFGEAVQGEKEKLSEQFNSNSKAKEEERERKKGQERTRKRDPH